MKQPKMAYTVDETVGGGCLATYVLLIVVPLTLAILLGIGVLIGVLVKLFRMVWGL